MWASSLDDRKWTSSAVKILNWKILNHNSSVCLFFRMFFCSWSVKCLKWKKFSSVNIAMQGCTIPRHQVTWATKFCMVALNICGFSVCNLFHVSFVAHDICGSSPELHQVTSFLITCSRTFLIYLFLRFAGVNYGWFRAIRFGFNVSSYIQNRWW